MTAPLASVTAIDRALGSRDLRRGLERYLWLQERCGLTDVRTDTEFRRRFNTFYKVRRDRTWQDSFYDFLERGKMTSPEFRDVLEELHARTGRLEASFASKLVATLNPSMPVIDAFVLRNVGLRLPSIGRPDRLAATVDVHRQLADRLEAFLVTPEGRYLVAAFERSYPDAAVSDIKKVDLVLWQTRPVKGESAATPAFLGDLFIEEPEQWGLRGDPFLWRAMRRHLSSQPLPATLAATEQLVTDAFQALTGRPLSHPDAFYLEAFAHGGMSSGGISPEFWRDEAIPLLRKRHEALLA